MAAGLRLKPPGATAAWPAVALLLAAGALAGARLAPADWDWQAARLAAEPWRLWTAAWVHLDHRHLAANLAGAAVVGAFGWAAGCRGAEALAWLAAWPLGHAALALDPAVLTMSGMSGVLHAGVAVAALRLLVQDSRPARAIGAAVALGLLAKVLLERPFSAGVHADPMWAFPVVVLSHATGAAAGFLTGGVACATSRRRRDARMPR